MTLKTIFLLGMILSFCSKSEYTTKFIEDTGADAKSRILFSKKRISSEGWSIYSINPDGTDEKIIVEANKGMGEYNPAVSNDGKTIIFNTYRYGGWKLAAYEIGSGEVKRITGGSEYFTNPHYSPNAEKIVYEKSIGKSTQICVADKNGSNEIVLTSDTGQIENRIPIFTPDGRSVIYYAEKDQVNDIYIIDIETRIAKNLTNNSSGNDFAPSISPDGRQIAFFSDRNGYLDLYKMDVFGNDQTLLTRELQTKNNEYNYYRDSNMYWIFKSCWSPDGKYLVFSNSTGDNIDLFTIEENGTNVKNITNSPQSEYTPFWGGLR